MPEGGASGGEGDPVDHNHEPADAMRPTAKAFSLAGVLVVAGALTVGVAMAPAAVSKATVGTGSDRSAPVEQSLREPAGYSSEGLRNLPIIDPDGAVAAAFPAGQGLYDEASVDRVYEDLMDRVGLGGISYIWHDPFIAEQVHDSILDRRRDHLRLGSGRLAANRPRMDLCHIGVRTGSGVRDHDAPLGRLRIVWALGLDQAGGWIAQKVSASSPIKAVPLSWFWRRIRVRWALVVTALVLGLPAIWGLPTWPAVIGILVTCGVVDTPLAARAVMTNSAEVSHYGWTPAVAVGVAVAPFGISFTPYPVLDDTLRGNRWAGTVGSEYRDGDRRRCAHRRQRSDLRSLRACRRDDVPCSARIDSDAGPTI